VLKPLKAYFGYKMIREISRADVREFCTRNCKRACPRTVKIMVGVLGAILNMALEDELINKNPAAKPGKSSQ